VALGIAILAVVMLRSHNDPPPDPDATSEPESEEWRGPPEQVAHVAPTQFSGAEG
jgi:hypothetical protein